MKKYYFAAPLYKINKQTLEYSQEIHNKNREISEKIEKAGISLILPQRDINQTQSGNKVLNDELKIIKECDGLIVLMGHTPGIWVEVGLAKAWGKKIYGIKLKESWNLEWLDSLFDFISEDVNDIINKLK
ncbi:MAG: nucleoside 2-deoxyribosyltransferase [Nanoarchaeota archaeon]